MAPAGQVWSTVDDLARWAAVLASTAEPPVLRAATLAQMATPAAIADPDGWTAGYGLGLQLWRRGERVFVGHTGSMPGYLAVLAAHRPSGTAAVAFANTYGLRGSRIGAVGLSIVEAVLDCEPEGAADAVAPARATATGRGRPLWTVVVDGRGGRGALGRGRRRAGADRAGPARVAVRPGGHRRLALSGRASRSARCCGSGATPAVRPWRWTWPRSSTPVTLALIPPRGTLQPWRRRGTRRSGPPCTA